MNNTREKFNNGGLFYLVILISVLLISLIYQQSLSSSIFILVFNLVLLSKEKSNAKLILLNIGFLFAILLALYWDIYFGSSYYLGARSDDYNYDEVWSSGYIENYGLNPLYIFEHIGLFHNSPAYVYLIIVLKFISNEFLFGYNTIIPRIVNVFLLYLTAELCGKIILKETQDIKLSNKTFYIVFFFPVLIFNSLHVFRDTLIMFLIVYVYYIIRYEKKGIIILLKTIISVTFLFFLREIAAFILIGLIPILIWFRNEMNLNIKLIISTLMLLLIFFIEFSALFDLLTGATLSYNELNVDRLGDIGSNIFAIPYPLGIFPRISYLILTPVPSFSSLHGMILSVNPILQLVAFPYLFYSLINKNVDKSLKIFFLVYFIGVAVSTATFRHVNMYLPFGITLAMLAYPTFYKIKAVKFVPGLIVLLLLLTSSFIIYLLY